VKNRGVTLIEMMVAMSILITISTVTTMLYRNVIATVQFATARMDSKQALRNAVARFTPLLQTAYIPTLPGATACYENAIAPYPSGVNAANTYASSGPGVNSFLFYSPADLIGTASPIVPVVSQSIHLYELRLLETLDPDISASGRTPLTCRSLVLQERQVPATYGKGPFPLVSGRTRVVARSLSDLRVTTLSSIGVQIHIEAQARQQTVNSGAGQTIITNTLDTKIYFPVLSN
jgi:prepilin-type N-terminal cleavage/methylation domain-containing protein